MCDKASTCDIAIQHELYKARSTVLFQVQFQVQFWVQFQAHGWQSPARQMGSQTELHGHDAWCAK